MIRYIYQNAEEEAFESLHMQTKQFKEDIQLQIKSDIENLVTLANVAAQLYEKDEDFTVVIDSFEEIGLIADVGILLPNNTMETRKGRVSVAGKIDFHEEVQKGTHTTGKVSDLTDAKREIIRSATPIVSKGETIGILYGLINLNTLNERYRNLADSLDAQLYVYEREKGNILLDTFRSNRKNIAELKEMQYKDDFSYEAMMETEKGYTAFVSPLLRETLYLHYSPLDIEDWQIMLARTEKQVFANAHHIAGVLFMIFALMLLLMAVYFVAVFRSEMRRNEVMKKASEIRKLLLDINQQHSNITQTLETIAVFSNARSAVFVDTDQEDHNYISANNAEKLLGGKDRSYFVAELFRYATEIHQAQGAAVSVISIEANKYLRKNNPEFYRFLLDHQIEKVIFSAITDKHNHIGILGVLNPQKPIRTRKLLYDISICFSIAIYNKKKLNRTELAAETDSMTGLKNRLSYNKMLDNLKETQPQNLACVYVDVNELHLYNNRLGHAAGDEMLCYIANTLKELFYGNSLYRLGGDEFLAFVENTSAEEIRGIVACIEEQMTLMNYHIAVGTAFRAKTADVEEMVKEAEKRMYEKKAQYYQNKEQKVLVDQEDDITATRTGIDEIDALLSVLKEHYCGVYRVSLRTNAVHRLLMPAYLGYEENENDFASLFSKYIGERVNPDFHRAIMSFLDYGAIETQLEEGVVPRITYKKIDGEMRILSVYPLKQGEPGDTLWVFARA
ncbi:MAG: GGDEF domain-containing protein [Clostridia bacterium]|nr:GGDEF domain-containing protein [Clostridia bacterium]